MAKTFLYKKPTRWAKQPGKGDASKVTLKRKHGSDWNWLFESSNPAVEESKQTIQKDGWFNYFSGVQDERAGTDK